MHWRIFDPAAPGSMRQFPRHCAECRCFPWDFSIRAAHRGECPLGIAAAVRYATKKGGPPVGGPPYRRRRRKLVACSIGLFIQCYGPYLAGFPLRGRFFSDRRPGREKTRPPYSPRLDKPGSMPNCNSISHMILCLSVRTVAESGAQQLQPPAPRLDRPGSPRPELGNSGLLEPGATLARSGMLRAACARKTLICRQTAWAGEKQKPPGEQVVPEQRDEIGPGGP
jgi:hypothetical protein